MTKFLIFLSCQFLLYRKYTVTKNFYVKEVKDEKSVKETFDKKKKVAFRLKCVSIFLLYCIIASILFFTRGMWSDSLLAVFSNDIISGIISFFFAPVTSFVCILFYLFISFIKRKTITFKDINISIENQIFNFLVKADEKIKNYDEEKSENKINEITRKIELLDQGLTYSKSKIKDLSKSLIETKKEYDDLKIPEDCCNY